MWGPLSVIRSKERRDTFAALAVLLTVMAAHGMLETAKDALFLAAIPAERLPWMVLGIAGASLLAVRAQRKLGGRDRRRTLTRSLIVAALVTGSFVWTLPRTGAAGLYGLYVWSGVQGALVLVVFWTLLGDLFSVTQAKRLFPLIGAGGVAGAIVGSGAAAALARAVPADRLLLGAAVLLVAAAALSRAMARSGHVELPERAARDEPRWARAVAELRTIAKDVYARRVLGVVFLVAAAVTVGDFLFKHTIAREIPAERLAETFGVVYLVLNLASLVVQLALVRWVTRRLTVVGALAVLPLALGGTGLAMLVAPTLIVAFAIKGADGSLRHSLDQTARELLFVPLSAAVRGRLKPLVDVLASRGGRAAASLAILGLVALEASDRVYALLLAALCALALVAVARLRTPYLTLFRDRLGYGAAVVEPLELDAEALETLVAALDSPEEDRVLVALDHLADEGRARLVPGLILHHPSPRVVCRALDLFADSRRERTLPVVARLCGDGTREVRTAAIAARAVLDEDPTALRAIAESDDDDTVRGAAEAALLATGHYSGEERRAALDRVLHHPSNAPRIALAKVLEWTRAAGFADALGVLAMEDDEDVRVAAARAMGAILDPAHLPSLIALLRGERSRRIAVASLGRFGAAGYEALLAGLRDIDLASSIRWRIPAALIALAPREAAVPLLEHLPSEPDGMVRYRAVRALELVVRDHPDVRLDRGLLDEAIAAAVTRAYVSIDRRLALVRGVRERPERQTTGHQLLVGLVESKRDNAVGRLLRLLSLLRPNEDFALVRRGLASDAERTRASSLELLENVLRSPLREAVIGLVDHLDDEARLRAAGPFHTPSARSRDYEALLSELLESRSTVIRAAATHHIGELRLRSLAAALEPLADDPDLALDVAWSKARLEREVPVAL